MLVPFFDSKGLIHKEFLPESTHAEVLKRLLQRVRLVRPELKSGLDGKRFTDITDIQSNVTAELKAIPKELFYRSFQDLNTRSQQCITIHSCLSSVEGN
ncbi:hypothetical protein TNCV_1187081 [Trichonephila clavipes]|nr:hypothetical protein TNCV_1187081 [Trichonephila clavipes]